MDTSHGSETSKHSDDTAATTASETTPAAIKTPDKTTDKKRGAWRGREFMRVVLISLTCLALLTSAVVGYVYASTPVSIREPLLEHYHFRMEVLVNGKAENFGDSKYQTGYSKDNCNAVLPSSPIHFHDNKNQFVHIHWEGTTGGQVLKYYGWNFIGGVNNSLGYRFDELPKLRNVPLHGKVLPAIPEDAQFYIYTGDRDGDTTSYRERKFDEFTHQDIEQFLGKTSNFPAHKLNQEKRKTSLLTDLKRNIMPTASAHVISDGNSSNAAASATHDMSNMSHSADTTATGSSAHGHEGHSDAELKRINNLLGNVVIFVQKDKPTDQQIKDRFNRLEPLSDSTCGG